jgi:hypothetical protein
LVSSWTRRGGDADDSCAGVRDDGVEKVGIDGLHDGRRGKKKIKTVEKIMTDGTHSVVT